MSIKGLGPDKSHRTLLACPLTTHAFPHHRPSCGFGTYSLATSHYGHYGNGFSSSVEESSQAEKSLLW